MPRCTFSYKRQLGRDNRSSFSLKKKMEKKKSRPLSYSSFLVTAVQGATIKLQYLDWEILRQDYVWPLLCRRRSGALVQEWKEEWRLSFTCARRSVSIFQVLWLDGCKAAPDNRITLRFGTPIDKRSNVILTIFSSISASRFCWPHRRFCLFLFSHVSTHLCVCVWVLLVCKR